MKKAVILFNLGGPESPETVRPFLYNLFSDKAILNLPQPFRQGLAWLISKRRTPEAQAIYARLGGRSPILPHTEAQASALQALLGETYKVWTVMRYWHPRASQVVQEVKAWAPDHVVLLPLYPQFSTTTTASSLEEWHQAAAHADLTAPTRTICCYPHEEGFIKAYGSLLKEALQKAPEHVPLRVLLSAHGIPASLVKKGDPYEAQVNETATALRRYLQNPKLELRVCYQSKVGPLKWLGPAIGDEVLRAGKEGVGLIVLPVAFVSDHSETLVELDHQYREVALKAGVPYYDRVPAVQTHPAFLEGLRHMITTPSYQAVHPGVLGYHCGMKACPCKEKRHVA